jgi:hypothetical protein
MLKEIKEKLPPKYTPKKVHFLLKENPPLVCFHPTLSKSFHHQVLLSIVATNLRFLANTSKSY